MTEIDSFPITEGKRPAVPLTELTAWLDSYLKVADFKDWSNNGLQVEGNSSVTRIAASVDTSVRSIEDAIASGASAAIASATPVLASCLVVQLQRSK